MVHKTSCILAFHTMDRFRLFFAATPVTGSWGVFVPIYCFTIVDHLKTLTFPKHIC